MGNWYVEQRISPKRMLISSNSIVSYSTSFEEAITKEQLSNLDWKIVNTIKITQLDFVEEKDMYFGVVSKIENEKVNYKGMSIENTSREGMKMLLVSAKEFTTEKEAQNDIQSMKFVEVQQVPMFSEGFDNASLKSPTQMSKEEYITLIKNIKGIEQELVAYVNTLKEAGETDYKSIGESLIQSNSKKFMYLAGYDPYAMGAENAFEQFNKDPEIMKLLNLDN